MDHIAVFAGLGSDVLFSDKFLAQAQRDAASPIGAYLLQQCYQIFLDTVRTDDGAPEATPTRASYLDAGSLIRISSRDASNSIMQHSTICLAQLLRYLQLKYIDGDAALACNYTTGLCAGVIPAVAVATSSDIVAFLTQAQHAYRLALHVGRAVEDFNTAQIHKPSAIFVDGILASELNALIARQCKISDGPLYISSRLTRSSFVVTGAVSQIEALRKKRLASRRVKSAGIARYYHNAALLDAVARSVVAEYAAKGFAYPSCADLQKTLISPANGQPIDASSHESLLELIVAWIFRLPVNWAAVDEHLAGLPATNGRHLRVENFGPGYGAMRGPKPYPNITVQDMTFASAIPSTASKDTGDIAIVGMAAHVPDGDDIDELWSNLANEHNSCREIPASRFDYTEYYSEEDVAKKGRSLSTKWGNFLRNPFAFDAKFFGVSPREALSIDPQQRMMLKTAHRALEHAGYSPDATPSFAKETFACYVGEATNDYVENLRHDIDVYYTPGTHPAFLSGRVSYYYGWSGPSVTVNTVCSSSMTAVNTAVRALQAGDCRSALVGGVNVITSPDMYLGLDRAHFLSPTGQCKTFDSAADGYCRAEACGAVVLKSLTDALAEGDRIHGIIRASELNQSGSSTSITHPHPPTQQKLLERLLSKSGISANDVTVVEAHGTGTQAGDPSELSSISGALCAGRPIDRPLYVVSHKANMGHSEAASGLIATIKMCLMFQNSAIPPQALLKTLNPRIKDLEDKRVVIPQQRVPWLSLSGRKRVGVVNNFGAAGSNGAILLEEPEIPQEPLIVGSAGLMRSSFLLRFTAKNDSYLDQLRQKVLQHLSTVDNDMALQDLCYTLSARRISYERQIIVSGRTLDEVKQTLSSANPVPTSSDAPVAAVFVFSGQGAQYLAMGKELYEQFQSFHNHVEYCHELLRAWDRPSFLSILLADRRAEVDHTSHAQIQAFQVAVFVLEASNAEVYGYDRGELTGENSLGEYAALVIGGALALDDALRLVSDRAALLVQHCEPGQNGMLAVNASINNVQRILEANPELVDLEVSCDNAPQSCVVGGARPSLALLSTILKGKDIKCVLLDIPFAFHTNHVDAISAPLNETASRVKLQPLQIPTMLNAKGAILQPGATVPGHEYFAEHCKSRVRFSEGIVELQRQYIGSGRALWIEIGPHASTLPMIRPQASGTSDFVPTLDKKSDAVEAITRLAVKVAGSGYDLAWRRFFEDFIIKPRLVSAPGVTFQESQYYVPFKESLEQVPVVAPSAGSSDPALPFKFLSRLIRSAGVNHQLGSEYETDIMVLKDYITGHTVCDVPLCPASVFHELAMSATALDLGGDAIWSLSAKEVSYLKPLVFAEGSHSVVRTIVKSTDASRKSFKFEVYSGQPSTGPFIGTLHCSGVIQLQHDSTSASRYERLLAESDKMNTRLTAASSEVMNRRTIYNRIFSRVVNYSSLYQSIDTLKINVDADEAVAKCTRPNESTRREKLDAFTADPVMMDTLLHTTGFICNLAAKEDEVFIGHSVDEAFLLRREFDPTFSIRSTITSLQNGTMTVGDAIAIDSKGVIAVITGIRFQRLSLPRMRAALSLASTATMPGQTAVTKPIASAKHDNKSVVQSASTVSSHRLQKAALPPPQQGSVMTSPAAASKHVNHRIDSESAVIDILAASCSVSRTDIKLSAGLDELGIDSLLMLEMEESFRKIGDNSFTAVDFEKCITVGDIVKLINSAATVAATTEPAALVEESAADYTHDILSIIAKACDLPTTDLALSTPLDDLGIDSLLMIEMEESFREIGGQAFTAVDFEKCLSVGDIVNLINSANVSYTVSQPQFATQASPSASRAPAFSNILSGVRHAIAKCCKMESAEVTATTDLDDLGIDSLMMLELESEFHEIAPNGFKTMYLKDCRSVQDIADLVAGGTQDATVADSHAQPDAAPAAKPASIPTPDTDSVTIAPRVSKVRDPSRRKRIPMDPKTEQLLIERLGLAQQPEKLQSAPPGTVGKAAIFLIHAGSGFSRPYYRLSSLLGRDIWAIHDDKLLQQHEPWNSVAEVAQTYAGFIRKASNGQPAIISGWSFGGIIAYEVAKLLQREGSVPVPGLLLCDPPPPNGYTNPRVADLLHRLFAKIFGVQSSRQNALGDALHKIAASNAIRCADLLADYTPTTAGRPPKTAFLYAVDPVTTEFLAEEGDEHAPYDAWLCERENRDLALGGWFELLGREINIIDLPGNHYNILERDKVESTSAAYMEACEWIESGV